MSSEEMFHTDFPDLQGFIKKLNVLDENVNKAVFSAMPLGGSLINAEQKRLIAGTSQVLSNAIHMSRVFVNRKGVIAITSGYQEDAFNYTDTVRKPYRTHTVSRQGIVHDGDYWMQASPGVIGLTYEFGRPGKSSAHGRNKETMKQVRRIIPNRKKGVKRKKWHKAIPTEITVRKGSIQPTSHIIRGFQNKLEPALGVVIGAIEAEIKKAENG